VTEIQDEDPRAFATLYVWFVALMVHFVKKFGLPRDEPHYLVHGSPIHEPQIGIKVSHLRLLDPEVIETLQHALSSYPRWEIAYTVDMAGKDWPEMGLLIRKDSIIDGLLRRYFPPEYQSITYEGSRPGDIRDLIARSPTHPEFEPLFRQVDGALAAVAELKNLDREKSYSVLPEYPGGEKLLLIASAALMLPEIIAVLQYILRGFPAWTIMVMPDHIPQRDDIVMVVEVRHDEIVDRLDRSRLPPEYANLHYPGAHRAKPLGEAGAP
jgi:hypothetical protein